MKEFYKSIDKRLGYEEIAKKYFELFLDKDYLNSFKKSSSNFFSNNNFTILDSGDNLEFLTKRVSLISDKFLLTHNSNKRIKLRTGSSNTYIKTPRFGSKAGAIFITHEEVGTYIDCSNLNALGKWLLDCKDLICGEDVLYIPNLSSQKNLLHEHELGDFSPPTEEKFDEVSLIFDAIIRNKKIVELKTNNLIKSKYLKAILTIEIPTIENVSMSDFSKLSKDEASSFEALKLFLRDKFFEIKESEDTINYNEKLEKIANEIKKGIVTINNDFRQLERKRAFNLIGASMATTVASLVAIHSEVFELWGKIIGSSGGAFLFFKGLEHADLEKLKLKNNQYYYLWLLNEKSK